MFFTQAGLDAITAADGQGIVPLELTEIPLGECHWASTPVASIRQVVSIRQHEIKQMGVTAGNVVGDISFDSPTASTDVIGVVELTAQAEMDAEAGPTRVPAVRVIAEYVPSFCWLSMPYPESQIANNQLAITGSRGGTVLVNSSQVFFKRLPIKINTADYSSGGITLRHTANKT